MTSSSRPKPRSSWRSSIEIAYTTEDRRISIIGVFHGGRDYETFLQPDEPEE